MGDRDFVSRRIIFCRERAQPTSGLEPNVNDCYIVTKVIHYAEESNCRLCLVGLPVGTAWRCRNWRTRNEEALDGTVRRCRMG